MGNGTIQKQRLYFIDGWDAFFENARSRQIKLLGWVPIPVSQDGAGYRELIQQEHGPALFGTWIAIVEIAAKCSPRGVLVKNCPKHRNDPELPLDQMFACEKCRPLYPRDLAFKSGIPESLFEETLTICCHPLEWMGFHEISLNGHGMKESFIEMKEDLIPMKDNALERKRIPVELNQKKEPPIAPPDQPVTHDKPDPEKIRQEEILERFKQWWKFWPTSTDPHLTARNVEKEKTKTRYLSLVKRTPRDQQDGFMDLLDRKLQEHLVSEQWNQDNGKYIPYPAKWLGGDQWRLDLSPDPMVQARLKRAEEKKSPEIASLSALTNPIILLGLTDQRIQLNIREKNKCRAVLRGEAEEGEGQIDTLRRLGRDIIESENKEGESQDQTRERIIQEFLEVGK